MTGNCCRAVDFLNAAKEDERRAIFDMQVALTRVFVQKLQGVSEDVIENKIRRQHAQVNNELQVFIDQLQVVSFGADFYSGKLREEIKEIENTMPHHDLGIGSVASREKLNAAQEKLVFFEKLSKSPSSLPLFQDPAPNVNMKNMREAIIEAGDLYRDGPSTFNPESKDGKAVLNLLIPVLDQQYNASRQR